jgi:hypothetical protein
MGSPETACITFGSALFMRVPCPAARTMAVVVFMAVLSSSKRTHPVPGTIYRSLRRLS